MDDAVLGVVLDDVASRLRAVDVAWRLGGSAGRRVRGVQVEPGDVDIVVASGVGERLSQAFRGLAPADHPAPPDWQSAWLLRWRHPDGPWVEFIGGAAVVVDGTLEVLSVSDGVEVAWRGRTVAVSRPEVWDRLARS